MMLSDIKAKFDRCPICDTYGWTGSHVCKPRFICTIADDKYQDWETSFYKVFAGDAEDAAAKFMARVENDWCEYSVGSGLETIVVRVIPGETFDEISSLSGDIESCKSSLDEHDLDEEEKAEAEQELDRLEGELKAIEAQWQKFEVSGETVLTYHAKAV